MISYNDGGDEKDDEGDEAIDDEQDDQSKPVLYNEQKTWTNVKTN